MVKKGKVEQKRKCEGREIKKRILIEEKWKETKKKSIKNK